MIEILILVSTVCILLLLLWRFWRDNQSDKSLLIVQQLEEKHRAMLLDFNDGLNKLGDRLSAASLEMNERLRLSVANELQATRDAMQALQLAQNNSLAFTRETVLEKLQRVEKCKKENLSVYQPIYIPKIVDSFNTPEAKKLMDHFKKALPTKPS